MDFIAGWLRKRGRVTSGRRALVSVGFAFEVAKERERDCVENARKAVARLEDRISRGWTSGPAFEDIVRDAEWARGRLEQFSRPNLVLRPLGWKSSIPPSFSLRRNF